MKKINQTTSVKENENENVDEIAEKERITENTRTKTEKERIETRTWEIRMSVPQTSRSV